ncbi:MAG: hypothetical protein DRN91_00685 [Candidatus Alkanophagales archaeon]|nr:MAG: hypothetical protein DRN91_00685 [Candidatus Alkanophagales archaeon]
MEIKVKCKDPKICMKCIRACPAKVLVLKPISDRTNPHPRVEKWEINVMFKDLCNRCMKCVEVCPKSCIEIIDRRRRWRKILLKGG